jgi:hypothetical protein
VLHRVPNLRLWSMQEGLAIVTAAVGSPAGAEVPQVPQGDTAQGFGLSTTV